MEPVEPMADAIGTPGTAIGDAPDVAAVVVPPSGRVLIASDLHLGAVSSAITEAASTALARRIERWSGPGVVVFAGDTFELWAEPNNTPAKALRSHPRFTDAVSRFAARPDRQVVVLAGNHDGALGWDAKLAGEVSKALGAAVYQAVDLEISTGAAVERVRVEHGIRRLKGFRILRDQYRMAPGIFPTVAGSVLGLIHFSRCLT